MSKTQQRMLRFPWQSEINGKTPRVMLVKWLASNHDAYFRANNLAEVVERFRLRLVAAGFRGCTIDEIQTEITGLVSNDPILQWLQPGHTGQSRMDILVAWLGENQAAYARAKLAKSKERLLAPLVAQIVGIGFSNCKARDQRIHIKHLKEHCFRRSSRLSDAESLHPRSVARSFQRPAIRAAQTTYAVQAAPDFDHESASSTEPPIKAELGFPDGSVHAPFLMYGDDDDDRPKRDAVPANTLTLDEIHRLEALIDARLKFGGKKTLSQEEIDLYFPKPRK
ncbi:hypothetical protein PHYSODRAFT_322340 [Phytophthora sojae]|uniref:Uncharacterized protein n=1 Tax=Phytophthora sojae (strain P6497) TaxID=1094619 RepID=G4YG92_PHYSP|nr:hypothetical protein PHYSODRAFT_322340 [Phytophthora sojae]EGZ28704.1 hypothetical protein PHYSODRAFT_322340 [Phytophthora sojae]|eukprot:XP_009515979.1 hypothetical protein PHYSODRAFT_322340 [Phytophthora sojae]